MSWLSDATGIDIDASSGGNSIESIIPQVIKSFKDIIKLGQGTISNVGSETEGAVKSGGTIIRNTIDTGIKAIEDTADEIGRVDDNILGGFTKQGFEAVTAGFKSKLNEVGSAIFKGNAKKDGSSKDLTGLTADLMFGGNNGKRKKGKVSSGMGLSVAEDTGLQS